MAKIQQHFKTTTCFIVYVRSAARIDGFQVTQKVTASLVRKPLIGDQMPNRSEIIRGARGRDTLKFASTKLIFLIESVAREGKSRISGSLRRVLSAC